MALTKRDCVRGAAGTRPITVRDGLDTDLPQSRGRLVGHLAYMGAWLLAGAALLLVSLVAIEWRGTTAPGGTRLAVREPVLAVATRRAGCGLRSSDHASAGATAAVAEGLHRSPLGIDERRATQSNRMVVIECRRGLDAVRGGELAAIPRVGWVSVDTGRETAARRSSDCG